MKTNETDTSPVMKVGAELLVNIPPGWVIVGRVVKADNESVVLSPAAYCETITESGMSLFSLCKAGKKQVYSSATHVPILVVRREAIFFHCPIEHSRFLECVGKNESVALDSVV